MIHIERFLHTHIYKKKERERNKNTSLQVNLSTSAEAFITGFRCWVSFYITHRLIVFQFNNTSLVASPCPYFFHQTIIVFRDARMLAIFPISIFSFGFFVSRFFLLPLIQTGNRTGINILLLSTCLQLIENFKMKIRTTLASQGI